VKNPQPPLRNVFKELNSLYTNLVGIRPKCFLSQISNVMVISNGTRRYKLKCLLLPHQILILPVSYRNALSNEFLERFFRVYSDQEIRLEIFLFIYLFNHLIFCYLETLFLMILTAYLYLVLPQMIDN